MGITEEKADFQRLGMGSGSKKDDKK